MLGATKTTKRRLGFTLIELLVVISIIALLIGILLPSLGQARLSASKTKDQANVKGITMASHSYASDNGGKLPPDLRDPAWQKAGDGTLARIGDLPPGGEHPNVLMSDPDVLPKKTWFGQLYDRYLNSEEESVDCPVIDDHRREGLKDKSTGEYIWKTDYSINPYAWNVSTDIADEPSRNVLFAEPNMPRMWVGQITRSIAYYIWWGPGTRDDLEQRKAGSLSFGFVDGHASRVTVPDVKMPFFETAYPELSTEYATPTSNASKAHENAFLLNRSQGKSYNPKANFPAWNDLVKP
ncbi:MAG: prepilin-type N-terminal cleavage/methylation domain-containing protein [Phycisphaeraceae bacterium]|nr:prepilin-type N-terminal cleavage/methylation domain-containing protein [Phycisphaeraceae bacterium]